jgi:GNAT superfamily N-acetyltransferase
MEIITFDAFNRMSGRDMDRVVQFLNREIDQFADSEGAILKSVQYAIKDRAGLGGYVFEMLDGIETIGVVVVNRTGMEEYMPDNILVYLAIKADRQKKGYGKKLLDYALEHCEGEVMIHISEDNPAYNFFKKVGFKTQYQEMYLERN